MHVRCACVRFWFGVVTDAQLFYDYNYRISKLICEFMLVAVVNGCVMRCAQRLTRGSVSVIHAHSDTHLIGDETVRW